MKATEHKETGEKMHVYEVGYLVMPTVSEDQVSAEVSWLQGILAANHATIIAEEFPKLQPLAYTMEKMLETKRQKLNEGYFGWIKFEMPVSALTNITTELDKRATIIRHLIIKTVRENTLYATKLAESARRAEEEAQEGEKAASQTEVIS